MSVFSKPIYELEPSAFGLDITDLTIRAVRLIRTESHQIKLTSYVEVFLQPGFIENGVIKNEAEITVILKDLNKETQLGSLGTKFVVASLPEQDAFMQVVSIPKMKPGEITKAVRWEMEGNIPMKVAETHFDWQLIEPIKHAPDHLDVLVAASPKNIIEGYVRVIRNAGFEIKALEIESTGSVRALFKESFSPKPVLVVDVGASRTSLVIFSGSAIRFTSSISVSGSQMTKVIAELFKIGVNEAEKIKRNVGLDKSKQQGRVFKALEPILENLITEIKKYLSFYKSHNFHEHGQSHTISKILLSGGGANLKGLAAYFGSKLKMTVDIGNPWSNVLELPVKELPALPFDKSLSFVTAIGLALRGLPR